MINKNILCDLIETELGYELVKSGKDSQNMDYWIFRKNGLETKLDEDIIIKFYVFGGKSFDERMQEAEAKFLERLKDNPLRFD